LNIALLSLNILLLRPIESIAEVSRDLRTGFESWFHHDPVKPLLFPILSVEGGLKSSESDAVFDADLRVRISPSHPES